MPLLLEIFDERMTCDNFCVLMYSTLVTAGPWEGDNVSVFILEPHLHWQRFPPPARLEPELLA